MPELPEVETVRAGMEMAVCGKAIAEAIVRRSDLRIKVPYNFAESIRGKIVKSLARRGKYIVFEFENDPHEVAILHLGMSGRVRIYAPEDFGLFSLRKHDHIILKMEDNTTLVYEDPRRFGAFFLSRVPGVEKSNNGWRDIFPFDTMGPEPLEESWDGNALYNAVRRRSAPIKTLLLDQRVVAGLGNIYVCEALYAAGINPKHLGKDLAKAKCDALVRELKAVLYRAIEAGGSTLRDYQKTDGSSGYFQYSFHVYGREGLPCMKNGCKGIISRILQGGRSTFYCSTCQK